MADKKISALTAASTPLAGSEVLPIVQGGSTVKVSIANVTAGRDINTKNVIATGQGVFAGPLDNFWAASGGLYGYYSGGGVFGSYSNASGTLSPLSFDGSTVAFRTANVSRLEISNGGDVTAKTGNLVIGTAGKGIDFSANANAPGMTSELLDDYEEGTWVPSVGGDATYTIQEGYYVRVGDLVYIQCQLIINALGTGNTTTISGLPFTALNPANSSRGTGSVWYCANLATNVTSITPGVTPNGTSITFGGFTAAGASMSVPLTVFGNGTRVDFSLVYRAN